MAHKRGRIKVEEHKAKPEPQEDHSPPFGNTGLMGSTTSSAPTASGWSVALLNEHGIEVTSRHGIDNTGMIAPFRIPAAATITDFVIYKHHGHTATPVATSPLPSRERFDNSGQYTISSVILNGNTLVGNMTQLPVGGQPIGRQPHMWTATTARRWHGLPRIQSALVWTKTTPPPASQPIYTGQVYNGVITSNHTYTVNTPNVDYTQKSRDALKRSLQMQVERTFLKDAVWQDAGKTESGTYTYRDRDWAKSRETNDFFRPAKPMRSDALDQAYFETHDEYHQRSKKDDLEAAIAALEKRVNEKNRRAR